MEGQLRDDGACGGGSNPAVRLMDEVEAGADRLWCVVKQQCVGNSLVQS